MSTKRAINFSAGPAKLPHEVLLKAQQELVDYAGLGMSVMEISHRSKQFLDIIQRAENDLRSLLNIPTNYKVVFLQGGASTQFAMVPLNLMMLKEGQSADYIVTGTWSIKAYEEAKKYGKVNLVLPLPSDKRYVGPIPTSEWKMDPQASYVYYCANETVDGVEFNFVPETHGVPLVCDMSSNMLSREVDISKYALIFAGAQKNMGPSGVTLVIIREDLLSAKVNPLTPTMLNYKIQAENASLYNTPPAYSIYICGLVYDHFKAQGGLSAIEKLNIEKSTLLYSCIDFSNGFYTCPVKSEFRSRMNIPYRILGGNEDLENKFIKEAETLGMTQLRGHRSVGGIRASLYNAITLDEVQILVDFMKKFYETNKV